MSTGETQGRGRGTRGCLRTPPRLGPCGRGSPGSQTCVGAARESTASAAPLWDPSSIPGSCGHLPSAPRTWPCIPLNRPPELQGKNDKRAPGSGFIFGTCMKSLGDERHFFYLNISRQLEPLITDKGSALQIRRERAGAMSVMFMQTPSSLPRRGVRKAGKETPVPACPRPPRPGASRCARGGVPTPCCQTASHYRIQELPVPLPPGPPSSK